MQIKTFHIRLSREYLSSDENKINKFLSDKEVINTFAELIKTEKLNYWSMIITYSELKNEKLKRANDKIEKLSYSKDTELTEKEQIIYDNLKLWRTDKAATENISSFVIAYDTELITIAKEKITSIDDFKNIKGFGEKKIAKYGDDIIALLNSL